MLQDIFWAASASVPENSVTTIAWLQLNPKAFPEIWLSILNCEEALNSEPLVGKSN
jgi:nucleolar pre-ribosomal-associated protein 2